MKRNVAIQQTYSVENSKRVGNTVPVSSWCSDLADQFGQVCFDEINRIKWEKMVQEGVFVLT